MTGKRIWKRTAALCLAGLMTLSVIAPAVLGPLPETEGQTPVFASGLEQPKLIALTFDDGPRRSTTTALLDGLAERGVKATFFLIGTKVEGNEDLVRRMEEEGHQVGMHTNIHICLAGQTAFTVRREVTDCRLALTLTLGEGSYMLRPPYGAVDRITCSEVDCPMILWSVDPKDWKDGDSARQLQVIREQSKDGGIILLHDIYPSSVATALAAVDQLKAEGYFFVTVEQMFALRGIDPQPGRTYSELTP